MNITWYGTASLMIEDGETKLLFDPFVRQNKKLGETTPLEGFKGADAVLITHGHFDHLYDVPALTEIDESVQVYCTKTPAETLKSHNVSENRISEIAPGDTFKIGNFNVSVYRGKHIVFDPIYILTVTPKFTVSLPTGLKIFSCHKTMPENHEIVIYDVENKGKHILITGSFGYAPDETYPENPDLFVLANGGSVLVPEISKKFIDQIKPKKILVDHFDDAFPPLTRRIDLTRLKNVIHKSHPEIEVIEPTECVPVAV